jgi:multiple sugar transport system permease protein
MSAVTHTPAHRRLSARRLLNTAAGVLILSVMLFPVYWMINVSLQPSGTAVGTPWLPLHPSLRSYATALSQRSDDLVTSLLVAGGSAVLSLLIAAPAAYALAQFRIRVGGMVLLGVLISQMIPGIVIANALYSAYNDLGLLNSVPGLILANCTAGVPFAILVMRAFFTHIPKAVIQAARVDGASQFQTFVSVVLPMSRNSLIVAGLFTFLFAWSDFLFALTLTTTEDVRPVTLGIYQYIGAYVNDWSSVMATAVLASIPAVALLAVAQRYISAGITAGAVK